jgi:hypothetical protein
MSVTQQLTSHSISHLLVVCWDLDIGGTRTEDGLEMAGKTNTLGAMRMSCWLSWSLRFMDGCESLQRGDFREAGGAKYRPWCSDCFPSTRDKCCKFGRGRSKGVLIDCFYQSLEENALFCSGQILLLNF